VRFLQTDEKAAGRAFAENEICHDSRRKGSRLQRALEQLRFGEGSRLRWPLSQHRRVEVSQ